MSSFVSFKLCKAAKRHTCEWCEGSIEKGSNYYRTAGKIEGQFYYGKQCLSCTELIDKWTTEAHVSTFELMDIQGWREEKMCPVCKFYKECKHSFKGIRCIKFKEDI